jgi:hypothetical protein
MSELQPQQDRTKQLQDIEAIRDLFGRAHDYIAQASHPGHLGMKIGEVLNFLSFQYADFKNRAEVLAKQIKSEVDVVAAKAEADKALANDSVVEVVQEAPKA